MTHKEMFEALLAGKTICWKHERSKSKVRMDGQYLVQAGEVSTDFRKISGLTLGEDDWMIDTPWYERIPVGGVLCWVNDAAQDLPKENSHMAMIHGYQIGSHPFVSSTDEHWRYATPVKKSEVNFLEDLE